MIRYTKLHGGHGSQGALPFSVPGEGIVVFAGLLGTLLAVYTLYTMSRIWWNRVQMRDHERVQEGHDG